MKFFILVLATLCGAANAEIFYIYSCPLSSSASSLSSVGNKDCSSSGRRSLNDVHAPYGLKHTYIQIGGTCYDWGDWNYPRHMSCSDSRLACCVSTRKQEYMGFTRCNGQIGTFENEWRRYNKRYNVLTWNCQKYSDSMKLFLISGCNRVDIVG